MSSRPLLISIQLLACLPACGAGSDPSDAGSAGMSGGAPSGGAESNTSGGALGTQSGGSAASGGNAASGGFAPGSGGFPRGSGSASAGGTASGAGPNSGGAGPGAGGGTGSGGQAATGGATGSGGAPSVVECGAGDFDAEVRLEGSTWIADNNGTSVYSGSDMRMAMQAAVDSLSPGRTSKERVVVRDSGDISAGQSVNLPSYTSFESCGTIHVTGTPGGDNAAVRGRGVTDIDVPFLTVTGGPYFGVFFRESHNIHLGRIDLRLSGGLGIRIDNNPEKNGWGRTNRSKNIRLDFVHVEGTNNHGVETYGVDGLVIGTVEARNTAYAGLLLNATINAEVGLVDAEGAGTGSGYAAFRMANENGRLSNFDDWNDVDFDTDYAPNIHVGQVRARGGGRGIFCVSGSGGAVIDQVDLVAVGTNPAIFIEDCYNVHIGTEGGNVDRGGAVNSHDISITARGSNSSETTFLHYSAGIVIENLTISNSPVSEGNCNESGNPGTNVVRNNTLIDSPLNVCPGTDQGND